MCNLYIKKITASLILAVSSLTVTSTAEAKKSDFNQEVFIKSERNGSDLKNKIFSYIENVVITQGTLTIKADLVQVIANSKSEEKIYVAKGSPAIFTQLLEDGSPISLQANEIKYEPNNKLVTISGQALLEQGGTKMSGTVITYNFLTEQAEATSDNSEQVETVLQPSKLKALKKKNK